MERLKVSVILKLDILHKGMEESREYALAMVMEDTTPEMNESRVDLLMDSARETALEKLRERGLVPPLKSVAVNL